MIKTVGCLILFACLRKRRIENKIIDDDDDDSPTSS